MVKRIHVILFSLLLLIPQFSFAAVNATLDQSITSRGESVLLTIAVDGDADGEPDLSVLQHDFDILSQIQSSNYSVVNGSFNKNLQWRLSLMPKRTGSLVIPAITVGNQHTQVLTLQVLEQQIKPSQARDIFLEMKASADEVYVQAQLVLTVKLFRAVSLSQAELSEPKVPHTVLKKLGDDKNYEAVVDQRRFVVTERKYALFAKQLGKLEVPAVVFNGRMASSRNAFGQGGKAIRLKSEAVHVNVLPKPNVWDKSQPWLPAQEVSLRELWTDGQSTTYKVGEPLTRTLVLSAQGLTAAQLPVLVNADEVQGFKRYPDQPVLKDRLNMMGIEGVRQEKIALIPTQAGEVTLPGIAVSWWNTIEKRKQTALIPARVIDVLPADALNPTAQNKANPQIVNEIHPSEVLSTPQQTIEAAEPQQLKLWQGLTVFFALGWLATALLWFYISRRKSSHKSIKDESFDTYKATLKALQKELELACKHADAKQASNLLPAWGSAFFQDETIQHIGHLKGKSSALDQAINDLEQYLYGNQSNTLEWSADALLQAIASLKLSSKKEKNKSGLKPLYEAS